MNRERLVISIACLPFCILLLLKLSDCLIQSNNMIKPETNRNFGAKTPVFALSHGGPTFMYEDSEFGGDKGAFNCTTEIGRYITEEIRPKFILYVSAHWQSGNKNEIDIGVPNIDESKLQGPASENNLIYDFYGFPQHMYKETFHSMNDVHLATQIAKDLNNYFKSENSLLRAVLKKRGIDHGVWVPLKVAFPDRKDNYWNVEVPIIQVSLTADDSDFETHYKLGQALSPYRANGGLIIVSGMSVHNLRDMALDGVKPYTKAFNKILRKILTDGNNTEKLSDFKNLMIEPKQRELLYSAHPTLEHFLPFIVGLGAGEGGTPEECRIKELYNNEIGSLGWGIYRYD